LNNHQGAISRRNISLLLRGQEIDPRSNPSTGKRLLRPVITHQITFALLSLRAGKLLSLPTPVRRRRLANIHIHLPNLGRDKHQAILFLPDINSHPRVVDIRPRALVLRNRMLTLPPRHTPSRRLQAATNLPNARVTPVIMAMRNAHRQFRNALLDDAE
jgi:hypothetical protein